MSFDDCSQCQNCCFSFRKKRPNQRFCSRECKTRWTNRTRTLKPNVTRACIVCGDTFSRYVEPSKIRSGRATGEYCSLVCKGKALSGERHPLWKGGRIVEADGYVMLFRPTHPHANNKGYVFEHRLVMETVLGRTLDPVEVIHHRDENPGNNDPSNLYLYDNNADHKRDDIAFRERDALGRLLPKAGNA